MPSFLARIPAWFRSAPVALTLLALVALGPLLPFVAPVRAGDLLGLHVVKLVVPRCEPALGPEMRMGPRLLRRVLGASA